MSGIDVSYDEDGESIIIWFDHPAKEHRREESSEGLIIKKDVKGYVIGVERRRYFAGPPSRRGERRARP